MHWFVAGLFFALLSSEKLGHRRNFSRMVMQQHVWTVHVLQPVITTASTSEGMSVKRQTSRLGTQHRRAVLSGGEREIMHAFL